MKRISALGFSLSAVLLSQSAWAQEQVYCPQEVTCAQSGPASTCYFDQHERGYWNDPVPTNYPPSVLAGQYRLSFVSASYQSRDPSYPICVYTHTDVYATVTMTGKPEANIERYDAPEWRPEEFWWECKPTAAESCPLFEQSAVFIQNKRKQSIIVSPGAITVAPNQYTRLFMDDFQDCPNVDACWVEIYTEDEQIGGLTVTMQENLKIVDIFSNIDVKSDIVKLGEFNAVEVR
jgi:hypothetical protein